MEQKKDMNNLTACEDQHFLGSRCVPVSSRRTFSGLQSFLRQVSQSPGHEPVGPGLLLYSRPFSNHLVIVVIVTGKRVPTLY